MWPLIRKEVVQLPLVILGVVVALVVFAGLFLWIPHEAPVWFYYAVVAVYCSGILYPTLSFVYEGKSGAMSFLRALPIHPRDIVRAKFAMTLMIILGFTLCLIVFGGFVGPVGPGVWHELGETLFWILLLAPLLANGVLYSHFRFGPHRGKVVSQTALVALMLVANILGILVWAAARANGLDAIRYAFARIEALAASPWGLPLAILIGLGGMFWAYTASVRAFTRLDPSELS